MMVIPGFVVLGIIKLNAVCGRNSKRVLIDVLGLILYKTCFNLLKSFFLADHNGRKNKILVTYKPKLYGKFKYLDVIYDNLLLHKSALQLLRRIDRLEKKREEIKKAAEEGGKHLLLQKYGSDQLKIMNESFLKNII